MTEPIDRRGGVTIDVQPVGEPGGRRPGTRRAVLAGAVVVAVVALVLLEPWSGLTQDGRAVPPGGTGPSARPDVAASPTIEAPDLPEFALPSRMVTVVTGEAPDRQVRTGAIPADAQRLALIVGCIGTGTLRMNLDGVDVDFDCARRVLDGAFVPPLSGESTLELVADGALKYAVSVRAWSPVGPRFPVPVLRLSYGGRTVPGFVGCGLSYQLPDGTAAAEQCGPTWMPMPDDRALRAPRRGLLVLSMSDEWRLVDVVADFTDHAGIVPARRDVPFARGEAGELGGARGSVPLLLIAGDFGLRLTVTAERDGARFTAPYYFRVVATP